MNFGPVVVAGTGAERTGTVRIARIEAQELILGLGRPSGTRLQPVHVEDVAEAIAHALQAGAPQPATYELGGPRVYVYKDLVQLIAGRLNKRRILFPMSFPLWHELAVIAEIVPGAPFSRSQVELMETDTVVAPGMAGFDALGITPKPIEPTLEEIIASG